MPTTISEATVELLDYDQFLDYAATQLQYDGQTEMLLHISSKLNSNPYNISSSLTTREQWAEQIMRDLRDSGYEVQYNGNNQWTGSVFQTTPQVTNTNPVNSNISTVSRGNIRNWYGGLNQFDGNLQKWVPTRYPVSGGLGTKAMYVLGSVNSAIAAVSAGIWCGKALDSALYNLMPDYWDSIGASTLNPETWGSLTNGDDSPFAGMLNFILGIDGEHGTAQAYMDQNQLAYMALLLKNAGWFNPPADTITDYVNNPSDLSTLFDVGTSIPVYSDYAIVDNCSGYYRTSCIRGPRCVLFTRSRGSLSSIAASAYDPFNWCTGSSRNSDPILSCSVESRNGNSYTYNNKTVYYIYTAMGTTTGDSPSPSIPTALVNSPSVAQLGALAWAMVYGYDAGQSIPGVSNQTDATLPDVSTWNDIPSTLQSLQNQYPDAFSNPMVWNSDSPYDDTAGNQTTYIPVPFPVANSATDTQPVSGTQTQTNTSLGLTPEQIVDLITKTVQQTSTQPATPPANPTDTGTGNTQTPTAPTGSASALWSVYHPTQAQINSFGAWLWGSPFLTNIGKLFQNPIDGVISLHKVFATPVDSGTGTIVVGTLDSNVSSATVNQQYIEVDCGSVNCFEDFGNVFDYEPYTKVSLYLPFIGIVPLNVSDVMRSTISITYGVDVFTGACIAMVEVSRDGGTINMYQYTGNCAVHYPLSNVQQSQLISGLLGIAAGVGSVLATGGVSAPAVLGMAGGALAAGHTSIGRSGGFSANAGAMGIKVPYLIIERPQTKVAETFTYMDGYPTNYSVKLGSCSNHVVCKTVHVYGINATESELSQIEQILKDGVEV